jgi:hypothetical protein
MEASSDVPVTGTETLTWGAEKSSRIQPQRVELEPGAEPWRIASSPWWLRCRLQGDSLQVAVRNCGRYRGTIRLTRGGATHCITVQSDARPTLGSGTRGAAILIVFALLGFIAGYAGDRLHEWLTSAWSYSDLATALMIALRGALIGAVAGLGAGGLPLVSRSALGGLLGALAASALTFFMLMPLLPNGPTAGGMWYGVGLLLLVPLAIWVPVGYLWGASVGGAWLARRGAAAGIAAVLLALPVGALVVLPWGGLAALNPSTGLGLMWMWVGVECSGALLFIGFLGALLAPCRVPK